MTWHLDPDTGALYDPSDNQVTTIDGPPYNLPGDAQEWAAGEFRSIHMDDLSTKRLADFAELWVGDIELDTPPQPDNE